MLRLYRPSKVCKACKKSYISTDVHCDTPTQSLAHLSVQVVEESSTSALFSLAMVIVYDECIISQVLTVQTLLTCLALCLPHCGGDMMDCYTAVHKLNLCASLSSLLLARCPVTCMCVFSESSF